MIKKIFTAFFFVAIFFISATTFAAYEETITEGADFSSLKTFAIALPSHYKIEATEPTAEEFADILSNASRLANFKVLSYDEVVDLVWKDARVELKALQGPEAAKIFNQYVYKYADAYILLTSANNNKHTQFFFEVRKTSDGSLLYVFNTQSKFYSKDLKGYTRACEEFYKRFNSVMEKAIKDSGKKKK